LAQALRAARAQGDAMRANVGGASVHMSAKGALTISREAPRRARVEPSAHHTVPSDEIDDASAIPSSLAAPG
jgi:hypothetical protein